MENSMDPALTVWISIAFLVAGLVLGAAVGAWLVWRRVRGTGGGPWAEADQARQELAQVRAELAAAQSESRVLTAERAADRDRAEQREQEESAVLRALSPVAQRLELL